MVQDHPSDEFKSECLDQKQLAILHEVACQAEKTGITLDEIFRWTVDRIAQKHPLAVATAVRIKLDGRETISSQEYVETPWRCASDIEVGGKHLGGLDICFDKAGARPGDEASGNAQQVFVEAVAARLGRIIGRFQVEEDLRQAEARFDAILKASPIGLILTRPADGTVVDLSGRTTHLSGHDPDQMKGKTTTELGIIDAEHRAQLISRLRQEGSVRDFEVPARHKNGSLHFLSLSVSPVVLKGETLLLTGAVDTTERKKAETLLRVENEISIALSSAHDLLGVLQRIGEVAIRYSGLDCGGIYLVDRETGAIDIIWHEGLPPAFIKNTSHFGMDDPRTQLVMAGKPIYSTLATVDNLSIARHMDPKIGALAVIPILLSGQVIACLNLGSHSLSEVPVESRQLLESIAGHIGRSIAEAQSREALRESEERYRLLADYASDTIWVMKPDGTFLYHSPAVMQLRGYTAEEANCIPLAQTLAPESLLIFQRLFVEENTMHVDRRWNTKLLELEMFRKDGTRIWVEVSANAVRDKGGNLVRLQGSTRDITNRRRAEEERQKLQAQLFHAQKMESIGTLAGGIAHDFNNLLTGIMGNLSLMELDLGANFPFYENIKEMERLVERGADLTRHLLGFARRGKYETKPLDIHAVVEETSKMFGRTRKDIVFHKDFSPGVAPVMADRTQMEQVLLNLLLNAGQAMSCGGELTLKTKILQLSAAAVALHGTAPGQYVQLLVADTGVGMDEDTRLRIFEPFFTTKGTGQGTGLGLASVYGIINNHGGFISVESEPGKGSTFIIHLPTTDKPIPREKNFPLAPRCGGETILVVDDEEQILSVCSRLLSSMGYKVLTARGGQEALAIFRQHQDRVSLIILDMIMPGTSGSQTFEALRQIAPSVKILLSSGFSIDGQAADLLARGCNGFLQKPFGASELSEKLKELL